MTTSEFMSWYFSLSAEFQEFLETTYNISCLSNVSDLTKIKSVDNFNGKLKEEWLNPLNIVIENTKANDAVNDFTSVQNDLGIINNTKESESIIESQLESVAELPFEHYSNITQIANFQKIISNEKTPYYCDLYDDFTITSVDEFAVKHGDKRSAWSNDKDFYVYRFLYRHGMFRKTFLSNPKMMDIYAEVVFTNKGDLYYFQETDEGLDATHRNLKILNHVMTNSVEYPIKKGFIALGIKGYNFENLSNLQNFEMICCKKPEVYTAYTLVKFDKSQYRFSVWDLKSKDDNPFFDAYHPYDNVEMLPNFKELLAKKAKKLFDNYLPF